MSCHPAPHRARSRAAALALFVLPLITTACDSQLMVGVRPGPWTGERTLAVAGTTLQARVDRAAYTPDGPPIVLLSGLDTPMEVWGSVRVALASNGPVFSYDRGGVGRSGSVGALRPSSIVADELRAALDAAGLQPPYLLVAHSIAGLHARVFAQRHPTLVAGLVLVDATHEAILGQLEPSDIEAIAEAQQFPGSRAEVRAQAQSVSQVLAGRLPDVPLVVLTSMAPEPGMPTATKEFLAGLQAEWLTQVTRGEQVRLSVGHMIPLEAPGAVVSAARRVLALRKGALADPPVVPVALDPATPH